VDAKRKTDCPYCGVSDIRHSHSCGRRDGIKAALGKRSSQCRERQRRFHVGPQLPDGIRTVKSGSKAEEQLRGLASRLQANREQERALASREVHSIGQVLTAVDLHLSAIAGRLSEGADASTLAADLTAVSELLASTIASSARISGELRPSILDNLGLADAITSHAREFSSRTGTQVFAKSLDKMALGPEVRILVFRLFQDILANIERHARATEVRVRLSAEGDGLVLRVGDNGRGITRAEIEDPKSLGLVEMRELALSFGGKIGIEGMPDNGTTVSVEIPLAARMEHRYNAAGM
jgi:signal transduction histidine kinase